MDIENANATAVGRMMDARPILKGVATARDVIPGMKDNLLLHAGPPITWARMSGPMRGAVIGALILEGMAGNEAEAVALAEKGAVEFAPNHEHDTVGPMAGVTSPSMKVYIVENVTHGNKAYCNFNEGYGKVLRMGAFSDEVIAKLRWINDTFAPVVGEAIEASGDGLDIRACWPRPCTWATRGTTATRPGRCCISSGLRRWLLKLRRTAVLRAKF